MNKILDTSKEFFEDLSSEEIKKLLNEYGFEYEIMDEYMFEKWSDNALLIRHKEVEIFAKECTGYIRELKAVIKELSKRNLFKQN